MTLVWFFIMLKMVKRKLKNNYLILVSSAVVVGGGLEADELAENFDSILPRLDAWFGL